MDGLTVFLELLKKMEKNPSTSSGWSQLDSVYRATVGVKGKKTSMSLPQAQKWNQLPIEKRRAGFIVAFEKFKKENNETKFLNDLLLNPNLNTTDFIFKYQSLFEFDGVNVTPEDVEIEKGFLYQFNQAIFEDFYNASIQFQWIPTTIEYENTNCDVKDLAMVKYVTSQYDLCDNKKYLTYYSMNSDEQDAFDSCLKAAIKTKNDTTDLTINALEGFAQYKLHQLSVDNYEDVGIKELKVNPYQKDGVDYAQLFEKHLLSFADVGKNTYLVNKTFFWKHCAPKWFETEFNRLQGKSHGILPLLNIELKKNDEDQENSIFLKQFYNCFQWPRVDMIPVIELVPFLTKFQPISIQNFGKEDMLAELALFAKFSDLNATYKAFVSDLIKSISTDETLNEQINKAIHLQFLSTSQFLLKSNPKQLQKVAGGNILEEKEESVISLVFNQESANPFEFRKIAQVQTFDIDQIKFNILQLENLISYYELLETSTVKGSDPYYMYSLTFRNYLQHVIHFYVKAFGEPIQVGPKTYNQKYQYDNYLERKKEFKAYFEAKKSKYNLLDGYLNLLHLKKEDDFEDPPELITSAARAALDKMKNYEFHGMLAQSIFDRSPEIFIVQALNFYKSTFEFNKLFDYDFEKVKDVINQIMKETQNACIYFVNDKFDKKIKNVFENIDKETLKDFHKMWDGHFYPAYVYELDFTQKPTTREEFLNRVKLLDNVQCKAEHSNLISNIEALQIFCTYNGLIQTIPQQTKSKKWEAMEEGFIKLVNKIIYYYANRFPWGKIQLCKNYIIQYDEITSWLKIYGPQGTSLNFDPQEEIKKLKDRVEKSLELNDKKDESLTRLLANSDKMFTFFSSIITNLHLKDDNDDYIKKMNPNEFIPYFISIFKELQSFLNSLPSETKTTGKIRYPFADVCNELQTLLQCIIYSEKEALKIEKFENVTQDNLTDIIRIINAPPIQMDSL